MDKPLKLSSYVHPSFPSSSLPPPVNKSVIPPHPYLTPTSPHQIVGVAIFTEEIKTFIEHCLSFPTAHIKVNQ